MDDSRRPYARAKAQRIKGGEGHAPAIAGDSVAA